MTESDQENSTSPERIEREEVSERGFESVGDVAQNAQEKISEVENGANQALENGEKRMKSAVELAMEKEDVNIPTEYLKVQEEMKNFSEETRLKVQEELDSLKFEAKMLEKEGREEDKVKNEIEPNIYKLEDKQRRLDDIEELLALKEEANRLEKEGKDEDKVVYILEPRIKELEKKLKGEKVEQNPEVAPAEEIEGNEADTEEKKSEASHHFEVAEEASEEPLSKDEVEAPTQETPIEQPAEEAPAETDEENSEEEKKEHMESPKIKLSEDPHIINALQRKLMEYNKRLSSQIKNNPYRAPEAFTDTNYKIAILEKLLTSGEVDTHELFRSLSEEFGSLNVEDYENACSVIDDYVNTGGEKTSGGTGFILEEIETMNNSEAAPERLDDLDKMYMDIHNDELVSNTFENLWKLIYPKDETYQHFSKKSIAITKHIITDRFKYFSDFERVVAKSLKEKQFGKMKQEEFVRGIKKLSEIIYGREINLEKYSSS